MRTKGLSFADLLDAACKSVPRLWNSDGKLNLTAVARYCNEHGYPVSQATLHRHYHPGARHTRELNNKTIAALSGVFRVSRGLWRGETLSADMEKALEKFSLPDLFLAEKISLLPPKARQNILEQIEEILKREDQLKRAYATSNVTPIERERR